jgi:hypothetical protein
LTIARYRPTIARHYTFADAPTRATTPIAIRLSNVEVAQIFDIERAQQVQLHDPHSFDKLGRS